VTRIESRSRGAAAAHIHVVVEQETGRVLGVYRDPAVAEAVVLAWGAGAVVRSVELDVVPAGIQATAKELGIVLGIAQLGAKTVTDQ
jgi:hypothetical protein